MRNLKIKSLKYNKGIYDLFEDRFVFFPPKLIDVLSSIYGEGVKSLLVWLGKKSSWNLIQNWEERFKPKNIQDLANQFLDLLSNLGWGKFKLAKIEEDSIIIELHHNISNNLESESKYICYFITGILNGFGEYALYKVITSETMCSFDNPEAEYCEFTITKID